MNKKYVSFKVFNSLEQATEVVTMLSESNIESRIKETPATFDATLCITKEGEAELFIAEDNIEKAKEVISKWNEQLIGQVEEDYYLFEFSNEELYEITIKKEEWSEFDVKLAERLLKERAGDSKPEELFESIMEQRKEEYPEVKKDQIAWVFLGYFFSLIIPLIGIVIGGYMRYSTKGNLPNGEKVYRFSKANRKDGKIMLIISLIIITFLVIANIMDVVRTFS